MKRREAKFVNASPRLSPEQIKAAPRLREDRVRTTGKGMREKTTRSESGAVPGGVGRGGRGRRR